MDLSSIRTDAGKESDGVWVTIDKDTRIKVRSSDTYAFERKRAEKIRKARDGFRDGQPLPPEVIERVTLSLLAEDLMVDWEGITDDGKELPYTTENAMAALRIKRFRNIVEGEAANLTNFLADKLDEDAKNSEPASAGN